MSDTYTCPGSQWNCEPFPCPYVTSLDKPCGRSPERLGSDYCDLHSVLSAIDSLDSADGLFELLEGLKR